MLERLSISGFTTYRWTLYQDVLQFAGNDINRVGIWRPKMDDFDHDEMVDLIYDMKMGVSSMSWAGGFTGADGRKFVDAVDDGIGAVQLAAQLNADCLIVHPGGRNGHTDRHAKRIFLSAIDNLAQAASDFGTRIAIEPIPHKGNCPWTFVKKFGEMLDLISNFDAEHVGLAIDLFHVGHLAEAYDRIPEYIDRVAVVQLADRDVKKPKVAVSKGRQTENRLIPGEGNVQIDRWIDKLNRHGYRGSFELEVHGTGFNKDNYKSTIEKSLLYLNSPRRSFNVDSLSSPAEKARRKNRKRRRQTQLVSKPRW